MLCWKRINTTKIYKYKILKNINHYGGINRDIENDILFQKHELNFNKIKSFKFFKNGRIDIEFATGQYALEFARDYCGYVG